MKKQIIIPTIALFIICLVATALLAFANNVTDPIIKENAVKTAQEGWREVLPNAKNFEEKKENNIEYVVAKDKNGNTAGMVFTTVTKSYGGDLKVMTGVDSEGKVNGVKILEISDTAGLGMKAQTEEFRSQFVGLIKDIVVMKNSSNHDNNEITALTGATITSCAVTDAVNEALQNFEAVNGGAN